MKHNILIVSAALTFLAVASAHAQTANKIKANIPFDFEAGVVKLKAGAYTIERIETNQIVLTSSDRKLEAFALAPKQLQRTRSDARGKLVFHRYGDLYFLAEVWVSRYTDGNGFYPSGAERRAGKELAKSKAKPEMTEILALGK
jgi:hypothetical protein